MFLSLLIYIRFDFNDWSLIGNGVFRHRIASSPFDVFLFAILRCSVVVGCTLGRALSRDRQTAARRLSKLTPLVAIATVLQLSYFVVKFLISKEYDMSGHVVMQSIGASVGSLSTAPTTNKPSTSNSAYHPWLWALLGWSGFATCVSAGEYHVLHRIKDDLHPVGYQRLININSEYASPNKDKSDSDTDSDGDKEMQATAAGIKRRPRSRSVTSQRTTVWRLFKMSKPDVSFIASGFFFLSLAAASDTFQPYYFGQVIDSIAIQQNENAFSQAIFVICGLALVSALGAGLRGMFFSFSMARLNIRIRKYLFGSLTRQEIGLIS